MEDTPRVPGWTWRGRLLAWSVPAALGVVYAARMDSSADPAVAGTAPWQTMVIAAATWYAWAFFTPAVTRLTDRYPLRGPRFAWQVLVHIVAALVVTQMQALVTALTCVAVGVAAWRYIPLIAGSWFLLLLPAGAVVYAAVVSLWLYTVQREVLARRERQTEQLALQLRESQLRALRGQLQPHFLFNTLTAITALVRDVETARAVDALQQLSNLMRNALRVDDRHEVPLAEEIARTRDYLRIASLRMGRDIPLALDLDAAAHDAVVPAWLLQPLVENVVQHGFRGQSGAMELTIVARVADTLLELRIVDNGRGLSDDWQRRVTFGHGVSNTRARLDALYGRTGSLAFEPAVPHGTVVVIGMPWKTAT
jgi:signal transduction histidine kinase